MLKIARRASFLTQNLQFLCVSTSLFLRDPISRRERHKNIFMVALIDGAYQRSYATKFLIGRSFLATK